jgi:hypothetical protein
VFRKEVVVWLQSPKIVDGHIFQVIRGGQQLTGVLYAGQVGRIFKRLARCAALPASIVDSISGHSLRVGSAQDLLVMEQHFPRSWSRAVGPRLIPLSVTLKRMGDIFIDAY